MPFPTTNFLTSALLKPSVFQSKPDSSPVPDTVSTPEPLRFHVNPLLVTDAALTTRVPIPLSAVIFMPTKAPPMITHEVSATAAIFPKCFLDLIFII